MKKIYLVEDELDLANLVLKYLLNEGYEVKHFLKGEDAITHVKDDVDLWVLDIMLPGEISGYDLIKGVRENSETTPVIFTSARDQEIDRVLGLELGGDDYLSKPYSIRELLLRIKNILGRVSAAKPTNTIQIGVYTVNPSERLVLHNNSQIELTSKEYDLLHFLMENQTKKFSREEILRAIWGEEYTGSDRVVDDLMRRLRNKMPHLRVETLYGYGYRLL